VSSIDLRVLGPLQVVVDGIEVAVGGPRPRAVLATLLVHAGEAVSADRLIDQVWGEEPPATAATALQVHISTLRKALGDRVVTTPSGYRLDVSDGEIDASQFEALVRTDLPAALALWRGEPYGGVPAGQEVEAASQRLSELRLSALEEHYEAELKAGRHTAAVAELSGLLVDHPVRERLAGQHILALYRSGRVGEAQSAYETLRKALERELGVEPSAETAALARAVDRRDPTLDPPSAVPVVPNRFIGRRRELEELAGQLGRTRLVTLTGPGGVGKTRLSLELARDTAADHPDGVYVVELGPAPAGSPVEDVVAAALTIRPNSGEPLVRTLARHLATARTLLVLDNCEHVIEQSAALAADLLAHCPGLRIVATSREPLGVPGEQVWPLHGLAVPADGDPAPAALRAEAVRLLADRGAAARPGFAIDGNLAVAGQLCRRLDGLPLAIELAAAQLRTLTLPEVAQRLGLRLDLADRRSRTTPDRHRTMRAAIDWSYQLLDPREQTLFRRLSVFVDGCVAEAAEIVGGESYDVLTRLVDRSLLTVDLHPTGTRFRMLELVREYACERLTESGEGDAVRDRHAAWFADLAEAAEQSGPRNGEWMRRLAAGTPNLRAAIEWSLGDGADAQIALRIASTLWWFWWTHGLAHEARGWLSRARSAGQPVPPALQARALRAAATLARRDDDLDEARVLGEESVAAFRAVGDASGTAGALNGLSWTVLDQRDYSAALSFGEESRKAAESVGDDLRVAAGWNIQGLALRGLGRNQPATAAFSQALQGFRAIEEWSATAAVLSNLAMLARWDGDLARCRMLYAESLALYRELNLDTGALDVLDGLAAVEVAEGRADVALRLLTVTSREWDRLGTIPFSPDRADDREATLRAARRALGSGADAVVAVASGVSLDEVVRSL
jgi:predicted ATPase/DNA-binding SARP family transcriptional activator